MTENEQVEYNGQAAPPPKEEPMSETGEGYIPEEAKQEKAGESKVVQAVGTAIEGVKKANKEYWDIRQEIDNQHDLSWHGIGVYKHWVKDVDQVSNFIRGDKKSALRNTAAFINDVVGRTHGFAMTGVAVGADLVLNTIWLPTRLLGTKRLDLAKRLTIFGADFISRPAYAALAGTAGAVNVVREVPGKVFNPVLEGVYTAPQVAEKVITKKVHAIVDWIKHDDKPKEEPQQS